jgi:hypothetical protein
MNNKTLAIAFGALLLIYLLTKIFGGNKERSFDPQIINIDTASVNKVVVHPAGGEEMFTIEKTGSGWQLARGGQQYEGTPTSVTGLLANLSSVSADRVVSKNRERYKDYAVDDEAGTRIELYGGKNKLGDIVVGRFNFNQATRSGISYIKKYDEEEVYSVEGFLSMSLSQGFDNYRNKSVLTVNAADLTKISLEESGQTSAVMKPDSIWKDMAGASVDSTKMANYLSTLASVSGTAFVNSQADVGERLKTLKLEGNNMLTGVEINCYASRDTSHHFVIHSSDNQEGYFFSDSSGIYNRLFSKYPLVQ